jgi:hypothetical protein
MKDKFGHHACAMGFRIYTFRYGQMTKWNSYIALIFEPKFFKALLMKSVILCSRFVSTWTFNLRENG